MRTTTMRNQLQPASNRAGAAWLVALLSGLLGTVTSSAADPPVVIQARTIVVGDGRVVDGGAILIQDGRIREVAAELQVPDGATVIDVRSASVTAGLIDANARIATAELVPISRQALPGSDESVAGTGHPTDNTPAAASSLDPATAHGGAGAPARRFEQLPMHVGGEPHEGDHEPLAVGARPSAIVNEQSSEVVPHTRVLDALDLEAGDFDRLVRGGVTTVYASPDGSAVIGARGAVVHTAGPAADRVLVPAAAVKATVGSEPSSLGMSNRRPSRYGVSMYARRPNSRMGLVWVFRKAFYDAQRRAEELSAYGSDTASEEATAVLQDVLAGKVPLRIQARIQRDILAALRLADEFELPFVLEEGTEAHLCLTELKARAVPVIFGPICETPHGVRAANYDRPRPRYFTFDALLRAGIPTALSAQELREEDGLARQAMYAMRFGTSFDEALAAVTTTPAKMLGLEDELGTIAPGKRADLVVWSGRPFAATSRILVVLVDGQVIVDRR